MNEQLRKYWQNPYIFNFETKIKDIDGEWITLEECYFYPESGGQLSDRGKIYANDIEYSINDVQFKKNDIWIKIQNNTLSVGDHVKAEIDKERRISLMRNHTAQHLISAIFEQEFGWHTTRAEINVGEAQVEIDHSPTFLQLKRVLEIFSEMISKKIAVTTKFYSLDEITQLKYRGKIPKDHQLFRMVNIGDYDHNLCGGTHVSNIGEIEEIFISKLEGKKIRYYTGKMARDYLYNDILTFHQIARKLSTSKDKVDEHVSSLIDENKKLLKQRNSLIEELVVQQLLNMETRKLGKFILKYKKIKQLQKNIVMSHITAKADEIIFVYDDNGTFMIQTGSIQIMDKIKIFLREENIRGGGKRGGNDFMGRYQKITELIEKLIIFLDKA